MGRRRRVHSKTKNPHKQLFVCRTRWRYLFFAQKREMEQDLERLSVGSQNNEFSDAAIECFGGYWYSKENKYNHTQRMYERA